ncbi:teichoic acid biosynthesis protein B [Planococcus sp. CPCC 101016]|uniref:CDP-glycerol glycerophosphotransferase family protein n=1 Tax=Planococcus sp. CPCC 101016 TaxID=2599617 RepID=UPI0011B7E595|nr:CDP-glycerol glycerophosphotransferase family protein [Planococcus sp. CPCC 101016]TWT07168.1 teichoic acid biosynthesis protein B [Planococcus sp. CPCC 101016]
MIKEFGISIYLFLFKILFALFKLLPIKNKTVFLSSFGDNAFFIAKELSKAKQHQIIFINQAKCKIDFTAVPTDNKKIYSFETSNVLDTFLSIYHLATSKYVFVDNYAGALSVIKFRKEVKCIQLWHAAGAIKKFGWSDPETSARSERAKLRFQQVYDRFQFIPVGSQQMADIFSESFHVDQSHFIYTGVPQTDFYFDSAAKEKANAKLKELYPVIAGKNIILYAPTFRKSSLHSMKVKLDITEFLNKLDDDYVLLIRLHPSVQEVTNFIEHPRVLLVTDYPHLSDLLIVSDILITDYSSIPVEFSLLGKKMIFFAYDLEDYGKTQGIWAQNSLYFPGPIVKTTSEVIEHILDPAIDHEKIDKFRNHWNTYSAGQSTSQLITVIYDPKDL